MSAQRHEVEAIIKAMRIAQAADATLRRFGAAEQDAERRARVRAMVRSTRSLTEALSRFEKCAAPHAAGVHCSSNMDVEVAALNEALTDFVFAMQDAADCCGGPQPVRGDTEVAVPGTPESSRKGIDAMAGLDARWLPLRWPQPSAADDANLTLPPIVHRGSATPHRAAAPVPPA